MKIAVVSSYLHIAHYGTDLEIIQRHLDNGDEVTQLYCDGEWDSCTTNIEKENKRCECCINQRKNGVKILRNRKKLKLESLSSYSIQFKQDNTYEFEDIEGLKKFHIENFDVGMAVASTLISHFGNPFFDTLQNKNIINKLINSSINVYYSCKYFLEKNKFDIIYIFNGRFALERAILRACEALKQDFITHERGCDKDHYLLFKNTLPHDINYWHREMMKAWELNNTNKYENAKMYFESRYMGVNKDWFSFTSKQKQNFLPESWDSKRHKIVIFNSSENEFAAIGKEWQNPLFANQLEGVKFIADIFRNIDYKEKYQIYLRLHPNLLNAPEELEYWNNELNSIKDILEVISPESDISSYALLLSADKIITFGSTMGIEATYWGKVSILLGKSFYYYLDAAYKPESKEMAEKMILDENLIPKNKEHTLIYGNYLYTCGEKYQFYQPEDLFNGKFRGRRVFSENIKSFYWHSLKQKAKIFLNHFMKSKFEIYE